MSTAAIRCPYHGVDGLAQQTRVTAARVGNRREVCNLVNTATDQICGMTLSLGEYVPVEAMTSAGKPDLNAVAYRDTHIWSLGVGWEPVPQDTTYRRYTCASCHRTVTMASGHAGTDCACGAYDWQPAHGAAVAADFAVGS
ncbi:MAG: hypothetical protein OXI12_14010 [Gammaproteobacteria bacterium]|nr:hypothetical protein [Gammaproteobacteria bacterium]